MSTYLTDLKTDVRNLLRDIPDSTSDRIITDTQLSAIITEQAALDFNNDFPRKRKKFVQGAGEYDYALPSDWVDDFSIGLSIENTIGSQTPELVEGKDWIIYEPDTRNYTIDNATEAGTSVTTATAAEAIFFRDGNVVTIGDDDASESNRVVTNGVSSTGVIIVAALANDYDSNPYIKQQKVLRFLYDSPSTTDAFLFEYTTTHTYSESEFTVPTNLQGAFKYLCTAHACAVMANHYGYSSDPSLDADTVDHLEKGSLWWEKYNSYKKLYDQHLGKDDRKVSAATAKGEYDISMPWGGDHIYHPRKWR